MSNRKSLFVLTALAGLLLAANLAVRYGDKGMKASGRQLLVEETEGVCGIRLERRGAPAVELDGTDGQWRLVAPYSGNVNEQSVMRFLDVLAMTPIKDVIPDSDLLKMGRARADFALADPVVKITLKTAKGSVESVAFGSATPIPGGVYATLGGVGSVFIVPATVLEAVTVDAEYFRRRRVFTFGPDDVASFGIKHRTDPPLEFSRRESGWQIRNAAVSAQKIRTFLSGVTGAKAIRFVWPIGVSNEVEHASTALLVGYGLDPDAAVTVTLKSSDGTDHRISFGKECEKGFVYALINGGAAIVTVPSDLKGMAEQDEGSFSDSRVFPLEARSVGSFSVADKDVLFAFVRGNDGGWMMESPIVAKADVMAVDAMLSRILSLSSSDVVSTGDGVTVSFSAPASKSTVSRTSVFGKLTAEDLRSKEIVRIDPSHVKRIVRRSGDAAVPIAVVYDGDRKCWNVESGSADAGVMGKGVERVLSAINPLVASRIVKLRAPAADLDDYGLDTPFLTVAIDQDVDGSIRRNIMVGKETEGGRFATVGSSDAVFVIGADQMDRLSAEIVGK